MSHSNQPAPPDSLFPPGWIVGPAAARLARSDKGVMVDPDLEMFVYGDPGGSPARPVAAEDDRVEERLPDPGGDDAAAEPADPVPPASVAPAVPTGDGLAAPAHAAHAQRPSAAEIASLWHEMARLERQLEAAQQFRRSTARDSSMRPPTADPADVAALSLAGDARPAGGTRRASRGAFRLSLVLLGTVVLAAAVGWVTRDSAADVAGRMAAWVGDRVGAALGAGPN